MGEKTSQEKHSFLLNILRHIWLRKKLIICLIKGIEYVCMCVNLLLNVYIHTHSYICIPLEIYIQQIIPFLCHFGISVLVLLQCYRTCTWHTRGACKVPWLPHDGVRHTTASSSSLWEGTFCVSEVTMKAVNVYDNLVMANNG